MAYTVPGIWYLLRRHGWSCQMGARRAIERDDGAVEVWRNDARSGIAVATELTGAAEQLLPHLGLFSEG